MPVRHRHDERSRPPHLPVQEAHGIAHGIVGAERVGADQLGQPVGLVRVGAAHRPHLVQQDGHAPAYELPGGLAAGETAADDVDGCGHADGDILGLSVRAAVVAGTGGTIQTRPGPARPGTGQAAGAPTKLRRR